jgi:hypothetical protein
MFVYPAPGLKVFDPVRKQFMPQDGMEVDDNDFYWIRRLRDGDVRLEKPKPAAPEIQAAAAPNKGAK